LPVDTGLGNGRVGQSVDIFEEKVGKIVAWQMVTFYGADKLNFKTKAKQNNEKHKG